jgi:uncharacterized membrane protein YcaP (DUF421 family)
MREILDHGRAFLTPLLGLGAESKDLTTLQVSLRGLIVFVCAIVIVRLGDKRFLSRKTAFDAVLGFILASMLSRAINGSAGLIPTICAGFILVLAHRLLAHLSSRWHAFGVLVKGANNLLIEDGRVLDEALRDQNLSRHDLLEDLRLKSAENPSEVKEARLERSGEISVILKNK